mmetsp:Transcript_68817/g.124048  ORF Transcript_68817/g.124048 Transcript_68817/m.124048 type:complete len:240 (-) Transcript_68817:162-881(-)
MAACLARCRLNVVSLHTLLNLRHQGVRHLRKSALRRAVCHVARSPAALHATANGVENVASHALLLLHHSHGGVRAQKDAAKVDFHNGLNGSGIDLCEAAAAAIDAGVVDPVVHCANLLLGEIHQLVDAVKLGYVAHRTIDGACDCCLVFIFLPDRIHRCGRVLNVANHDPVPALHELVRVGIADSCGTSRDHNASDHRGVRHARHGAPPPGAAAAGPQARDAPQLLGRGQGAQGQPSGQ